MQTLRAIFQLINIGMREYSINTCNNLRLVFKQSNNLLKERPCGLATQVRTPNELNRIAVNLMQSV